MLHWTPGAHAPADRGIDMHSRIARWALAGSLTISARADLVHVTFQTVTPNRIVELSLNSGAGYGSYYAGVLNWTTSEPSARLAEEFHTFCIELTEHVSFGGHYTYSLVDPSLAPTVLGGMGTTKANLLAELFGRYYPTANFTLSDQAAAFQLAAWEIVHDSGLDLATGTLRVRNKGAYWQLAETMLGNLTGSGPRMNLTALAQTGAQDQVVIPEPGSAMTFLTALAALCLRRGAP